MKARPVFLDFINREAGRAIGQARNENVDVDILRTLIIGLPYGFSANISQLTEYSSERPELFKLLTKLMAANVIDVTSSSGSMDEFLGDMQTRYSHVPKRYPFYYGRSKELEQIELGSRNDLSMTRVLGQNLLNYEPDSFQFDLNRANMLDKRAFDQGYGSLASRR